MRSPFPALALDLLNGVPQRFSLVTSLLFSSKLLCSVWCFWMQSYQAMVFPVVIHRCELDHKEGWEPKNWCFQTTVLEKTPESPLACKQIKPVNPKGNKSWIFIGRTCWSWSSNTLATWYKESTHWKRLDAEKDWGQEKRRVTEYEMFGWNYQLNEHEFEQTPGDSEQQGSLECCSP